jgi:hypothetical protein
MSLRSDKQQNIQTELNFSATPARRRMTPKAQPIRID